MRSARLLALVLLAAAPLAGRAADAPHEDGLLCSKCHMGHLAPGAGLTKESGNFTLCNSCHQNSDNFGFPGWNPTIQAVPGVSGRSHRWDAVATNMGAAAPSTASADPDEVAMAKRLDGGKLMCSTCHDQHDADLHSVSGRGRRTVSAVTKLGAVPVSGSGDVTVASVVDGASAKRYLLDVVVAGDETSALFRLSNDNAKSWFGCTTPGGYDYAPAYDDVAKNGCRAGATVPLNDAGKVSVAFGAGTYVVGDRFDFYVSYPYLRASIELSKMCVVCHKDRNMTTENVRGGGSHAGTTQPIVPGTTVFHHPVGSLAKVATTPLDASGVPQTGAGDSNPSNDLSLGPAGEVSCLSCHRVHNTDSNSLSPDP